VEHVSIWININFQDKQDKSRFLPQRTQSPQRKNQSAISLRIGGHTAGDRHPHPRPLCLRAISAALRFPEVDGRKSGLAMAESRDTSPHSTFLEHRQECQCYFLKGFRRTRRGREPEWRSARGKLGVSVHILALLTCL